VVVHPELSRLYFFERVLLVGLAGAALAWLAAVGASNDFVTRFLVVLVEPSPASSASAFRFSDAAGLVSCAVHVFVLAPAALLLLFVPFTLRFASDDGGVGGRLPSRVTSGDAGSGAAVSLFAFRCCATHDKRFSSAFVSSSSSC
jgi:hypothetical protein